MQRRKKTWGEQWRQLARCFVTSPGLRDAISHNCISDYYAHKKYFNTQFRHDDAGPFKHFLAVVAIMKDEGIYLAEWIEYHKLVGVDVFFIYDNESSDNTADILAPYIARGDVVHIPWPGIRQQFNAYNDALKRFRMETRWLAYIDADEFIVPLQKDTIPDILENYKNEVGLSMHWLMYGDNGHKNYEEGLVIERFTAHALKPDEFMKTIINPRAAFSMETHHGCFIGRHAAVNEKGNKVRTRSNELAASVIRVNHYWGKSWEEYEMKRIKGRTGSRGAMLPADDSMFSRRNRNEVQDTVLEKYVPLVKANIIKTREDYLAREKPDTPVSSPGRISP
ncbi:glycosyltransferase family 92 protein [Oxalobacter vibrioformis]|uniref:Glycosyltransferase family 92 protein n=1 Tax=Oxalobacter vibrioformis TaxID=933080 RepID=A0A9E9P3F3_9BURK|nr:glycosyltransferase family 92 protein [Oxalobacter vibrioformis]WAW10947.1 glycosyltransferase family 92 protein [Oxalobacter vibrioformis]